MFRVHHLRRIQTRRGSALAVTGVSLVVIMAVAAVVLDGGLLMSERRHAQTIADAAAMAAAYSLYNNYTQNQGLDPSGTAANEARSIASDNGYTNDGETSTVTVNIPPLTGSHIGASGYVEVNVQYNQPRCFSALWGAGTMSVTGRTVARGKSTGNYGVILLDPTMSAALSGTNSARLNVPNGTIAVDSSSSSAAKFSGSAGATAQTINITGSNSGGSFVGKVVTGATATSDPLTGLPAPDPSTMTVQQTSQLSISTGGSMTIYPGVYTGGISMSGGSLTMMPGIYYINGGGITTNSSASITGSGVMIYNGGSTVGSIKLTGSSSINLTPMSSGTYAGISIFQDRTSTATFSLTGTGGTNVTGGIYAPKAPLSLTGSSSTNVTGSFLIGDSATLTGTAAINVARAQAEASETRESSNETAPSPDRGLSSLHPVRYSVLRAHQFHLVRARRGSALAVTGVSLIVIMGVAAVVFDGGVLMSERRRAQTVADAAAMAAAYSLYNNYTQNQGLDPSGTAAKQACSIASDNGYTNDGATSTVTVNIPPLTGSHIGASGYVEVNVQYNQPRCFSAMWGAGTMSVTGRSVARGIYSPASPAILLLDPSMPKALDDTGNGNITASGGSIVVDSSDSKAANLTGNGSVAAPNINIYGNYNTSGKGTLSGTVKTGVAPTADPLSGLAVPSTGSLTAQSASNYQISSSGTYTLQPGVYTGGIAISAPGPGSVTLTPGIYYMAGGGFSISGSINVSGSGVMIYNAPVSKNDQVKLSGSGSLTVSAPTSGTYKGITIFQARASTAVVTVTGNGSMSLTGTIYTAGAEIDVTGNGGTNVVGSQIIADSMKVTGNGAVNVNYSASGAPVRDTRIVE